jgi:hypothetical protein
MIPRLAALFLPTALLLAPILAATPAAAQSGPPGGPPVDMSAPSAQNPPQYQPGMQYQNPADGGMRRPRGITKQEFVARAAQMAAQRFDEMDTNHDGVVSQQERMAYWQSRRAGGEPITVRGGPPSGP